MTGCRDMDKKNQKYPKNGGFPPFGKVCYIKPMCVNMVISYDSFYTLFEYLEVNGETIPRIERRK